MSKNYSYSDAWVSYHLHDEVTTHKTFFCRLMEPRILEKRRSWEHWNFIANTQIHHSKKTPPITKGSNECPMGALALSFVWIWMNALGNRRWNLHIRHSSVFPKRLWDYSRHLTLRTSTICKKHGRSAKQWTGCGRLKYGATPRGTICPGKRGFDLVTRVTSVWSTCISVGMYSNMHM